MSDFVSYIVEGLSREIQVSGLSDKKWVCRS